MIDRIVTFARAALMGGALLWAAAGCGSPSAANIQLRRQNQQLQDQLSRLRAEHQLDVNVIQGQQNRQGTVPTLPPARLAQLYTTHGIEFGRLTGGADLNPNKPGDEGLEIDVLPVDQDGDKLKASGTFDIEAFDLAEPNAPLLGRWHFDVAQAMQAWNGHLLEYNYIFLLPWKKVPRHADITVNVKFVDELTQTPFTAQKVVHVSLPPPATQP